MHGEQTYTISIVALGALEGGTPPSSSSRGLLTGVPGKYRKQRFQRHGFTQETTLSVFTQLQHAHALHTANICNCKFQETLQPSLRSCQGMLCTVCIATLYIVSSRSYLFSSVLSLVPV